MIMYSINRWTGRLQEVIAEAKESCTTFREFVKHVQMYGFKISNLNVFRKIHWDKA